MQNHLAHLHQQLASAGGRAPAPTNRQQLAAFLRAVAVRRSPAGGDAPLQPLQQQQQPERRMPSTAGFSVADYFDLTASGQLAITAAGGTNFDYGVGGVGLVPPGVALDPFSRRSPFAPNLPAAAAVFAGAACSSDDGTAAGGGPEVAADGGSGDGGAGGGELWCRSDSLVDRQVAAALAHANSGGSLEVQLARPSELEAAERGAAAATGLQLNQRHLQQQQEQQQRLRQEELERTTCSNPLFSFG